jgi:hypothetical protein
MPVPGYNSVEPMESTTSNESTKYNLKSPKQNKQEAQTFCLLLFLPSWSTTSLSMKTMKTTAEKSLPQNNLSVEDKTRPQ